VETLTTAQADVLNNLMPGFQNVQLGTALKDGLDLIAQITDSGTNSVKFDNSITPVYGRDNALVSIGTWNLPLSTVITDYYAPLQVNLLNTGNVAGDLAAARFKLATGAAQALVNVNVLELRETIAHNVAQWATLQASCAPAAHTIGVGEGLVGYFAMDGSGTITPAGSNAVAVLEVINNHTGAGVSDVAIVRNNATGFGATNVLKVENIIGTATNLINALITAGTVTNAINISGACTTGINIGAGATNAITAVSLVSVTVTETTATPGNVKTIWGTHVLNATNTSLTASGTRGEVSLPNSASMSTGTFAYGAQGKLSCGAGTTIAAGSGHVCGTMGQIDISGATTTSGHIACLIASIQDTTNSARPAVDGIYVELPAYGSGAKMNSVLKGFGGCSTIIDVSGAVGDTFFNIPNAMASAKVDADIAYAHYKKMPVVVGSVTGWVLIGLDA
jgi:hypothetical protein